MQFKNETQIHKKVVVKVWNIPIYEEELIALYTAHPPILSKFLWFEKSDDNETHTCVPIWTNIIFYSYL